MPRNPIEIPGWPKGINNVAVQTAVPEDSLRDAVNIDLSREGKPRKRLGRVKRHSGSGIHSWYSDSNLALFVEDGALKRYWPTGEVTELTTGLNNGPRMSYAEINGDIYYTNGYDSGIVRSSGEAESDGPGHPTGQPLLYTSVGLLKEGLYQVAVTFISERGEESGASLASMVYVSTGGGIQLTAIPQPAAGFIRIYATEPNGDVLRFVADVMAGTTTYTITDISTANEPLETQFCYPMPPGQITRYYAGRRWVASGSILYCSEALRYSLCKTTENYFMFPSRITNAVPSGGGMYVVADKTYYLSGSGPDDMKLLVVSPHTGVEGTDMEVGAHIFGLEEQAVSRIAYWFGEAGGVVGLPGGLIQLTMDGRVAVPGYDHGSSLVVEDEGIRRMITALFGHGDSSSYSVSDEVAVEVIRNGITL